MLNQSATLAELYAELDRRQDVAGACCDVLKAARLALKRSKSSANVARFTTAEAACDDAQAACMAAYDAIETAETLEAVAQAAAIRTAELAASPEFSF